MSGAVTLINSVHPTAAAGKLKSEPCLKNFDPEQVKLLEEECILVDEHDRPVGTISKKECHLMANINKGRLPFS